MQVITSTPPGAVCPATVRNSRSGSGDAGERQHAFTEHEVERLGALVVVGRRETTSIRSASAG